MSFIDVEQILSILFLVAVIASAIVGTLNPKKDSFLWKLVKMLNYISIFNPRGSRVITWEEHDKSKQCGKCKCKIDEKEDN